jgi:hypothetical protein
LKSQVDPNVTPKIKKEANISGSFSFNTDVTQQRRLELLN